MTAQIIPFPKRPEKTLVHLTWTGLEVGAQECSDDVHYFVSRDQPCQCGQERWPRPSA